MSPRPRLLLLVALAIPALIAAIWMPPLKGAVVLFNLLLVGFCVLDIVLSASLRQLVVTREVSEVLSVGTSNPVSIHVRNEGNLVVGVDVRDEYPEPGTVNRQVVSLSVEPRREMAARYTFRPEQRGRAEFAAVHLRSVSRWGLWTLIERRELVNPVRILPDIRSVYRYELLARKNRLDEMGLKMRRLRGQGSDFERLRDYRRGDEMRRIDWKATSRHRRLISREYNVERNQNVLLAVDCGRSMLNESEGVSYLDRALNSSIMLSYIALGQSDNVGFMAFSSRVERTLKPVRGKPGIQSVLQNSFDLQARREASDYTLAMEHLSYRFRKRSLVVLLTHVIDEQHLESISQALSSVRSPHLFLCVFLQDLGLSHLVSQPPESDVDGFQSAAAAEMLTAVERKTAALKDRGILTVSSLPDQLSADVINGYLDVKARHLM